MRPLRVRLPKSYCVHCLQRTQRGITAHGRCRRSIENARRSAAQVELGRFVAAEVVARVIG